MPRPNDRTCLCGAPYSGHGVCEIKGKCARQKLGGGYWALALTKLRKMEPQEVRDKWPSLNIDKVAKHVDYYEKQRKARKASERQHQSSCSACSASGSYYADGPLSTQADGNADLLPLEAFQISSQITYNSARDMGSLCKGLKYNTEDFLRWNLQSDRWFWNEEMMMTDDWTMREIFFSDAAIQRIAKATSEYLEWQFGVEFAWQQYVAAQKYKHYIDAKALSDRQVSPEIYVERCRYAEELLKDAHSRLHRFQSWDSYIEGGRVNPNPTRTWNWTEQPEPGQPPRQKRSNASRSARMRRLARRIAKLHPEEHSGIASSNSDTEDSTMS